MATDQSYTGMLIIQTIQVIPFCLDSVAATVNLWSTSPVISHDVVVRSS